MVSQKVQRILIEMSAFSACASSLIDQLSISTDDVTVVRRPAIVDTPFNALDVNVLIENINTLTGKVAELRAMLEAQELDNVLPDTEFDADSYLEFVDQIKHTIRMSDLSSLRSMYTAEYFRSKPRNVRCIVAHELLNHCARHSIPNLVLWEQVIAANGNLH